VTDRPKATPPPEPAAGSALGSARKVVSSRVEVMRTLGQLSTVGLSFALAILISMFLGVWLDRLTGLKPLFTITFFILGFVAGVWNVIVLTNRFK
jgi:ATP synthase protein I